MPENADDSGGARSDAQGALSCAGCSHWMAMEPDSDHGVCRIRSNQPVWSGSSSSVFKWPERWANERCGEHSEGLSAQLERLQYDALLQWTRPVMTVSRASNYPPNLKPGVYPPPPELIRCSSYTMDQGMRCVWQEGHDGDCAYGSAQADAAFARPVE